MVAMSAHGTRRESTRHRDDEPDVVEQLRQLKDRATDVAGAVGRGTREATQQLTQTVAEMTQEITSTIKEEAERLFDEQKGKAAAKVARYGKAIHQGAHALRAVKAEGLAEYVDSAADGVEGLTDYLEERTLAQVIEDTADVARRHPGITFGGMFLAGLAAARFLKASASRDEAADDGGDEGDEGGEESRPTSRDRRN